MGTPSPHIMNTLRVARQAVRAAPRTLRAAPAQRFAVQRRGYADVASDKIQLSLALPHQSIYKSADVVQVNLPAETGDMGVLANHVPSIEQLKPGLVEVIEESGAASNSSYPAVSQSCSQALSSLSTLWRVSHSKTSALRRSGTRLRRSRRLRRVEGVSRMLLRRRLRSRSWRRCRLP